MFFTCGMLFAVKPPGILVEAQRQFGSLHEAGQSSRLAGDANANADNRRILTNVNILLYQMESSE